LSRFLTRPVAWDGSVSPPRADAVTWGGPALPDRVLTGGVTAAGLVAFVIIFGMCGARLNFAIP